MRQEAEHGIFKPVLGALGVASLFLTIVGNLVFSPKSSLTPTQQIASTERALPAERTPQFEPAPVADVAVPTEPAPQTGETIVTSPVELQNSPYESASDVAAVEPAPSAEQGPKSEETIVALPAPGPTLPSATAGEVLVVEQAPQAEQPALPEEALTTDTVVAIVPAEPAISPSEIANDISVADAQPESGITSPNEEGQQQPSTVAAAVPPTPVVLQTLSHHERKLLRKAEHLEKKMNRLMAHGRAIACR